MKKKVFFSISIFLICISCTANNYRITGNIAGLKGWVYLELQSGRLDSVIVDNGKFTFEGFVQYLDFARLFNKDSLSIDICPDTKCIIVAGDINSPRSISISGSPLTDSAKVLFPQFMDRLMNLDTNNDSTILRLKKDISGTISANSDNIIGVYLLSLIIGTNALPYDNFTPKDQLELISILSPDMQEYPVIQRYKDRALLKEQTSIGTKFKDFEISGADGVRRKLSDFVGPGHYVLLDFWATWCGPCMYQVPQLVDIYKAFHSKGFEIVGVSLDDNRDKWMNTIKSSQMHWVNLCSLKALDCPAVKLYGTDAVPMSYLINSDGIIIKKNVKPEELSEFLSLIYKE